MNKIPNNEKNNYRVVFDLDKEKWSRFVQLHPKGNFFQSPEMFDVAHKTKSYSPVFIAILTENGSIAATLLAIVQNEKFLKNFTSRSIIMGGPLVLDDNPSILDFILKEYREIIRKQAIYTQIRNLHDWKNLKDVFYANSYEYQEHLDIIHDLTLSEEDQFKNIHKGRRKNIRRAERANLEFSEITSKQEINKVYELIKETYTRIKLPVPEISLFFESFDLLFNKRMVKFFVLKFSGEIINARVVLCYKNLIYDWYAGSSESHLDLYPNDYLPWKILQWGKANKFSFFDFGGAGDPAKPYSVRDYKLKFGGVVVEHGRFMVIHKPFLFMLGKAGLAILKQL